MPKYSGTLKQRFEEFADKYTKGYEEFRPVLEVGFLFGALNAMESFRERCVLSRVQITPKQVKVLHNLSLEMREMGIDVDSIVEDLKKRKG